MTHPSDQRLSGSVVGTGRRLHWGTHAWQEGQLPIPRDTHRRKITRRAVFARDNWTCQYCGSRANLTVDHVVPRSKGGPSSWENIVASCAPCNRRKGNALPRQVGMRLLRQPRTPSPHVFIQVATPSIPAAWRTYLAA